MANGNNHGTDWGSENWVPDVDQLTQDTPADIASGFGLDPDEYGMYITPFETWRLDFYDDKQQHDVDSLTMMRDYKEGIFESKMGALGGDILEAGDMFNTNLGDAINTLGDTHADTMSTMIDQQSSMVMGATGRTKRKITEKTQEAYDVGAAAETTKFESTVEDVTQEMDMLQQTEDFEITSLQHDIAGLELEKEYDKNVAKYDYRDRVNKEVEGLAKDGAYDFDDSNYDSSGYGKPAESVVSEYGLGHADSYIDVETGTVYKWDDPQGMLSNGKWLTMSQWKNRGCVIATHAVNSGAFTKKDKRTAVKWCVKHLHGTWWGEAFRRGYKDEGQRRISEGVAENYYQEFQDYVDFATGKKRTFKTFIVFTYRSIQLFLRGLRIK